MVAFIIWSIVASLFVVIGIVNWRSKTEVGFFTGVKPGKKKDIVGYNHAVAKIWFFYAAVLEMIGLPFVFIPQNSIMAGGWIFFLMGIRIWESIFFFEKI